MGRRSFKSGSSLVSSPESKPQLTSCPGSVASIRNCTFSGLPEVGVWRGDCGLLDDVFLFDGLPLGSPCWCVLDMVCMEDLTPSCLGPEVKKAVSFCCLWFSFLFLVMLVGSHEVSAPVCLMCLNIGSAAHYVPICPWWWWSSTHKHPSLSAASSAPCLQINLQNWAVFTTILIVWDLHICSIWKQKSIATNCKQCLNLSEL